MSHECPREGCTRTVSDQHLMCGPDWRRVPQPLQAAVYAACRHGAGRGSPELRAAQDAAIKAVNAEHGALRRQDAAGVMKDEDFCNR